MIKIDQALLEELGLGHLSAGRKEVVLRTIYDEVEMRVGWALADRMSDQKLDEFGTLIDTGNEAGALAWLETNLPDYKNVVNVKFRELCAEIVLLADDVLILLGTERTQERF